MSEAAASAVPHRIDVHHHHTPPAYVAAALAKRIEGPSRRWSKAKSLEDMDRSGVATAVVSITAPAVRFLRGRLARMLARACNEHAAKLVAESNGRFGMFAVVPMPDVDDTLAEIAYALDVLGADGIGLLTSYDDRWLGDPAFAPVWEELNRRRALVFVHPATAACCEGLVPGVPAAAIEWPTDTARTIASLVFSGTAARCPETTLVFSHGGGTMPLIAERLLRVPLAAGVPNGVEHELRRFYYDTAQATHPAALAALLAVVPPSQVVFGSDFPYRTAAEHVAGLAAHGLTPAELQGIERDNALALLPRLRRQPGG